MKIDDGIEVKEQDGDDEEEKIRRTHTIDHITSHHKIQKEKVHEFYHRICCVYVHKIFVSNQHHHHCDKARSALKFENDSYT